MLPGVLMVLLFVYIPVLTNIVYSFFRLSSYSAGQTFVGLDNYRRFFTDPVFPIMLKNNILYCVISLIVQVGFGTFLALVLMLTPGNFGSPSQSPWQFGVSLFLFAATAVGVGHFRFHPAFMLGLCAVAGFILL